MAGGEEKRKWECGRGESAMGEKQRRVRQRSKGRAVREVGGKQMRATMEGYEGGEE